MQLKDIKKGQKARILAIGQGEKLYRNRLIALGLLPGTEFVVSRIAPLGDPIEIIVRGVSLTLRKSEASILQIEEVEGVMA
jgi:Fe2+ transport system protein FeoA